ncbi:unnamed protein product [Tetraodon nigroviridis]|uniref:Chromosome 2 SCAF14781, whole genome shotgun sequence n=1 Tax=Tetraodon nigroviridis TaxID=99883 RepID=Q4S0F0_TETNG|nr:unnamed protein product [Tetraodon nigroviridis]
MAPRFVQASVQVLSFCLVAGQSLKYGLKGQEVKFKPPIQPEQQPDHILWMHNENKVVEFNGNEEEVFRTFKNRITLDWRTAELHLRGLRPEDSGLYELEVYLQKTSRLYIYNLQVIDKVGKPTITCETNTSDSSSVSGLLTCSAAQPEVEYMWVFDGNTQPGPQLRIFLGREADEQVYSCRVSNPLSNQTATFTAQDCSSGAGSSAQLVLSIVLPLLLLLLLASVAALVIYRRYYKGGRRGSVEGNTPPGPLQDLENNKVSLKNLSPQSQNHETRPLLDQRRDDESAVLINELRCALIRDGL